jgi:hypothetical protein
MSGEERRVLEEDGMCLQGLAQRDESKLLHPSKGRIDLRRRGEVDELD